MTAVTVVVAEAEAEAASVAAVGGEGSGANGSEIGASEGAEESAAKESVFHQRQSRGERRKRQIDQTPKATGRHRRWRSQEELGNMALLTLSQKVYPRPCSGSIGRNKSSS